MSIGRSCLRDKISAEARNRMNQFFIPRSVRPGKGFEPKFRSTSLIGSLRLRTLPRSSETGNRPHPKTINICVGLTQTSVRRKRLPLRWGVVNTFPVLVFQIFSSNPFFLPIVKNDYEFGSPCENIFSVGLVRSGCICRVTVPNIG